MGMPGGPRAACPTPVPFRPTCGPPRPPPPSAPDLLQAHGDAVTAGLRSLKGRFPEAPGRLLEAIEYSLLAGGKRLRPALVLETARACGAAAHTTPPPCRPPWRSN